MRNTKGFHYKAPEKQVLIVSSCNDQKFQQDSDVVALLMACAKQKDLSKGSRIHADILKRGLLEKNIYVGNNLVNMYAKCGALAKAQAVFDKLPVRNVFSWNALITGYAQHRHGGEVLNCFERMQRQGLSPNAVTFICILKACGSIAAADKGQQIHAEIVRAGLLEKNIVVGTALVDMYAKCGALAKAQEVFDELPVRDVVSWNALIAGYAQNGHGGEVLNCFERMQCQGLSPNAVTFTCILKACGSIAAADKGQQVHAEIVRAGLLENNIMVGTALVDMYAKCGALAKAQEVFDQLPVLNVVSWNVLIAGYAQHGHGGEVLNCFERMQRQGLSPDAVTFTCILKACGSIAAADKAQQIHAEIVRAGLLEKNIVVGTALVDMYAKCGALAKAQEVFDKLPVRDVVSWNALIAGYAQHGHGGEVLNCFERMQCEGLSPNAVTFICILKACGCIAAADKGQQIHAEIVRAGLLEKNIVVGTALVDMYAKCGALAKAQEVFDQLPVLNVVSWNALIAGYAQHGHGGEVLNCFEWMQRQGLSPDAVTFTCILKACGSIAAADKGQQIHAEIVRAGLLEKDIVVGTALVDMYAKCGAFAKAQEVFDELPVQDVVSWNALIAGYAQHGHGREVLNCFERMQRQGLSPDAVTFTCILKACGSIAAADKGQKIHAEIVRAGLLEKNIVVGTALVDMYAKCGALAKAQEVFDKLPVLNVVTWNALMAGYAQFGQVDIVFNLFNKMVGEGIEPNLLAFLLVLNACSHSGLLDKAQMYFETMSTRYGIIPTVEHHSCMVDLFGRAGHFDKAVAVIEKMPFSANLTVWCALLGACRKWGNVKLGRFAFEHAVQLDEKCAAAYVCMTNIYAAAGMQEDADKIEAMRVKKGAWKKPGRCWWTDVSGIVHSFYVGDNRHSQSKNIYKKLEDIAHKISQEGYSPGLHWVSQDISDDAKKDVLCGHSEKLAIACALINTPEGEPIRVVKNMRICGDCHSATSLISKIEKRKILVRDANRFHIFKDGKCDCGEYW